MRWFVAAGHGVAARRSAAFAAAASLATLGSCSAPPPPPSPPPPTTLAISITADADINPDRRGHGAPLVLRVYELAAATGVSNADFFELFNNDAKALGADLLHRDDVVLVPGGHKDVALTPPDNAHAVAVFASLRDPQGGAWRVVVPLKPHAASLVAIAVSAHGLKLAAPPPPPSSPAPPAKSP